jgi:hypothetical protein
LSPVFLEDLIIVDAAFQLGTIIFVDVVPKDFVEELVGLRKHVGPQVTAFVG